MSDDPIQLVVKLDDNEHVDLFNFLNFWKNKGLVIEDRINDEYINVYSEYVSDSKGSHPLNFQTYNSIYLPDANSELWVNFGGGDKVTEHYCIYRPGSNENTLSTFTTPSEYEFFIGISQSFLAGKILVIYMMYRQSLLLGIDEGYDDANQFFWDLLFKYLKPLKLMIFSLSDRYEYFIDFFIENNKGKFKEKVEKELEDDRWFTLNYYNKEWTYQDYLNVGLLNHNDDELYLNDYLLILIGNIYVNNFSAPPPLIEKCLSYMNQNHPNLFILNHYRNYP